MTESPTGLTIQDLRDRNNDAVGDQLDNRLFNPTFEVSPTQLMEMLKLRNST